MSAPAKLLAGVSLVVPEGIEARARLEISAGTSLADDPAYEEGARLPATPWRALLDGEWDALRGAGEAGPAVIVRLVSLPGSLVADFERALTLDREERLDMAAMRQRAGAASARGCVAALYAHANETYGDGRPPDDLSGGICVRQANLPTVTESPGSGARVGLHLDDWYQLPLDERRSSPNRICANVGACDRFFLFLNLPIDDLARMVRESPGGAAAAGGPGPSDPELPVSAWYRRLGGTQVARAFMSLFPRYPALRLRVRPGEAYMAATECIVHDGSSLGSVSPDLACSLRGRFFAGVEGLNR